MKNLIGTIIITGILFIISCDDGNPLTDTNRNLLDSYGELRDDTLYAMADTFIIGEPVTTGFSPKLLLGTKNDFEARFLIKFSGFPADTMRLDSVSLLLSSISSYGDKITPISARLYNVQKDWDINVNIDESWQNYIQNVDPVTVADVLFDATTGDSTDFVIDIPPEIVNGWQDTTSGVNYGLLIDYSTADHILEFASRENSGTINRPRIVYIYTDVTNDTTIRDTVLTLQDATLISFNGNFEQDKIIVTSGYPTYAFFKFDFSNLPKNINITSADFKFTEDSLSAVLNNYRPQTFFLRNAITEFNSLPDYELDSTFVNNVFYSVILTEVSPNTLGLDNSIKAGIGRTFFQSIINNTMYHGSFYVEYSGKGNDISLYAIRGSDDADINARPQLHLQYYLVPNGRL